MFRILALLLLPVICLAQVNSNGGKPTGELLSNEISPNEMKRNASFNLDEIKVRWKKAALENCTGVPCVVTPPPPPAPSFTCGTSTVTDVDGNSYNTVSIGTGATTQCWTASNLKVTKYSDGVTPIPDFTTSPNSTWATAVIGARTDYTGATGISGAVPSGQTYVSTYGYLYNWFAVNDAKGLCPSGWHVPTDGEWDDLTDYLGGASLTAGDKMKSPSLLWTQQIVPIVNSSGFTALPGGFRFTDGSFSSIRSGAFFWSASVNGTANAWARYLDASLSSVGRNASFSKLNGVSVRCLRD
jgi:uncharacterized protein (TIGR02145 family)